MSARRTSNFLQTRASRANWLCTAGLLLGLLGPGSATASTGLVPDDFGTIQAALDAADIDTVVVRGGTYAESPTIRRPVTVCPASPLETIVVGGLLVDYDAGINNPITISGLHIRRPVIISIYAIPLELTFSQCVIDSGFIDLSTPRAYAALFHKCTVATGLDLHAGQVYCDSSRFGGGIQLVTDDFGIVGCSLEGRASGAAIAGTSDDRADILGNSISNFVSAIDVQATRMRVIGNKVSRCTRSIRVDSDLDLEFVKNSVSDCDEGILAIAALDARVVGNVVLGCRGTGLSVSALRCVVDSNVVGRCLGGGIAAFCDDVFSGANNTVYLCSGTGIDFYSSVGRGAVTNNIVYANGGRGVKWSGDNMSPPTCNDLVGNGAGDDDPDNVSIQPDFCDLAADDVRLQAGSALVAGTSCGLIGALGVGCDRTTPTLVSLFTAERTASGASIRWQTVGNGAGGDTWVERSFAPEGPWYRIDVEEVVAAGVTVAFDRTASQDEAYWYRLVGIAGGRTATLAGPIAVSSLEPSKFAFGRVGPNPGKGPFTVEFSLASDAKIEIAAYDVTGRCSALLAHGAWRAGQHRANWTGDGLKGPLPAGIYLIRYSYPGGQQVRRLVLTK